MKKRCALSWHRASEAGGFRPKRRAAGVKQIGAGCNRTTTPARQKTIEPAKKNAQENDKNIADPKNPFLSEPT
jgi:hypothetical protein